MIRRLAAAAAVAALALAAGVTPAFAHGAGGGLQAARHTTAPFHYVSKAKAAGYGLLVDAAGIACIDQPGAGGMGVHYVNKTLVGDDRVDAAHPELVVYEPTRHGLRLVAAEYVVFQEAWDAKHSTPPRLFGKQFTLTPVGNRYGLPAFYELHAWIWKFNPRGLYDDWNPRVTCPAA